MTQPARAIRGLLLFVWPLLAGFSNRSAADNLDLRLSWGHTSPANTRFYVKCQTQNITIVAVKANDMEVGEACTDAACSTTAGGGDLDGMSLKLSFADKDITEAANVQSIWAYHIAHSDPDTVHRLRSDPAYRPDPRKLTIQLDPAGTRGFSLTVDQIRQYRAFWLPELDIFIAAGDAPVSFAEYQQQLRPWAGRRILDQIRIQPEATCEQFKDLWEDMGSPAYTNPSSTGPGHVICTSWDAALYKFGVDRGAGVRSDLGNPDKFRFWYDFGNLSPDLVKVWKGQHLNKGLPVVTTVIEQDGIRYEVEQFAYPLDGPPAERRGDIAMVMLQKVRAVNFFGVKRQVSITAHHQRQLAAATQMSMEPDANTFTLEDSSCGDVLLAIRGEELTVRTSPGEAQEAGQHRQIDLSFELPANGSSEFCIFLPSPPVASKDKGKLAGLSYDRARTDTTKYWSDYLAKGAQFHVPEEAVNELFRANLWHALRLPRLYGKAAPGVQMDLPYSNFAYGQEGSPWPVNQAVYVDYMIYDLRGYHNVSAAELAAMFRNNQQADGRVGGYANWGVYTPAMIYAVAKHYLLSQNRASFEALLPQTLKAWDWCLDQMTRASQNGGPCAGLILAPLNDLSHDEQAWAFNQAYFFAAADLLARALARIGHPRAAECRSAAQAMHNAIECRYGSASVQSPLVQLRDHTWMPYVTGNALHPGRLLDIWYPTDVDTGALHMARLNALDPTGPLATYLLNDHEDNLYYKQWGMANEPVYNQQATVYLLRDDPKAVIRAFYSYMACAFSHSTFEPVEHRWGWGQYFGPPSTDGAWFELYRNMLIRERDDDTLLLLQATPRKWLQDGRTITVEQAPTYYGPLSMTVESRAAAGRITADVRMPTHTHPATLLVRFRHPDARPIKAASVNDHNWNDFDTQKEWVRIISPDQDRYTITASY